MCRKCSVHQHFKLVDISDLDFCFSTDKLSVTATVRNMTHTLYEPPFEFEKSVIEIPLRGDDIIIFDMTQFFPLLLLSKLISDRHI